MITCGGQATIPMVAAVSRVTPVSYAEIVASVSSVSAGPGTRANIDEFTRTTAAGVENIGGAGRGKAIITLNPRRAADEHAGHDLLHGPAGRGHRRDRRLDRGDGEGGPGVRPGLPAAPG